MYETNGQADEIPSCHSNIPRAGHATLNRHCTFIKQADPRVFGSQDMQYDGSAGCRYTIKPEYLVNELHTYECLRLLLELEPSLRTILAKNRKTKMMAHQYEIVMVMQTSSSDAQLD